MIQNIISDILIFGKGRSASSIAACLSLGGSAVTLISNDSKQDAIKIQQHLEDFKELTGTEHSGSVHVLGMAAQGHQPSMVIIAGYTELNAIQDLIRQVEKPDSVNLLIAIATDHIPLSDLQANTKRPENLVVLNWAEPGHTTFFLEIVHNDTTDSSVVDILKKIGKDHWNKDPYTVHDDLGIRSRMKTAMLREAMYLVDKGYANVEDIDRACRNDAGTYMPFTGNFKYMDLMGTYAYGVVMEKLNKELSNTTEVPPFAKKVLSSAVEGSTIKHGFYNNSDEEEKAWETRMRNFSFDIRELIKKYP